MTPTAYAQPSQQPPDAAMAAAVAALTQQVTGLGSAITILAQTQNQQKAREQERRPAGPAGDSRSGERADGGGARPPRKPDAPEKRPGSKEDAADGGPLGKVLSLATAKVMAFLAPIVAVSTILGSTISGFGMFTAAIKVLASTIAPLLLPVFVLLAAAIVAISDELWEGIKNVLPVWYAWILHHGIPVFVQLVAAVRGAIDWFKNLTLYGKGPAPEGRNPGDPIPRGADGTPLPAAPVPGVGADRIREEWKAIQDHVRQATNAAHIAREVHGKDSDQFKQADRDRQLAEGNRMRYLRGFDMDPNEARRQLDQGNVPKIRGADQPQPGQPVPAFPGTAGAPPAARPSPEQRYNTALRDVVTSLRMQIAPPPAILASGGVNRKAQEDLMKEDPLERRMRERSLAAIDMLLQEIPKIGQNTTPRVPGLHEGR